MNLRNRCVTKTSFFDYKKEIFIFKFLKINSL